MWSKSFICTNDHLLHFKLESNKGCFVNFEVNKLQNMKIHEIE